MAGPGAVSHNFIQSGRVVIEATGDLDTQMLELIDYGVSDMDKTEEGIEIFLDPHSTTDFIQSVAGKFKVTSQGLVMRPNIKQDVDEKEMDKVIKLLDALDDHDDVQNIFTNIA